MFQLSEVHDQSNYLDMSEQQVTLLAESRRLTCTLAMASARCCASLSACACALRSIAACPALAAAAPGSAENPTLVFPAAGADVPAPRDPCRPNADPAAAAAAAVAAAAAAVAAALASGSAAAAAADPCM